MTTEIPMTVTCVDMRTICCRPWKRQAAYWTEEQILSMRGILVSDAIDTMGSSLVKSMGDGVCGRL
ncbi:MAG: hypothetical protein ACLVCH_11710 [Roseburia inulinivorans]